MKGIRLCSIVCLAVITIGTLSAQENAKELPFRKIPDYPSEYTAATTVARMIDALGFRYYWATEGLTKEDLSYQPSEGARSSEETIDHIFSLCVTIERVVTKKQVKHPEFSSLALDEKRSLTLEALKSSSDYLHSNPEIDMGNLTLQTGKFEFPFWNLINGQISDALTHVGQVVSFRRTSGNPVNPKVSVFLGVLTGE